MNKEILNRMQDVIAAYDKLKGTIYLACITEFDDDAYVIVCRQNIHSLRPSEMKKIMASMGKIEEVHKYGNTSIQFWFDSQEEFNKLFNEYKKNSKCTIFTYAEDGNSYGVDEEIPVMETLKK